MKTQQNVSALILTDHEPVRSFLQQMFTEQGLNASFCSTWEEGLGLLQSGSFRLLVADIAKPVNEEMHRLILDASNNTGTKTLMVLSQKELTDLSALTDLSSHLYYSKGLRPKMLWIIISSLIKNDLDETGNRLLEALVA